MSTLFMTWLRPFFLLFFMLNAFHAYADSIESRPVSETPKRAEFQQLLGKGAELIQAGMTEEAIRTFDQITSFYEKEYKNSTSKIYCARTPAESLVYMTTEAAENAKGVKNPKYKSAVVFSPVWAEAYYLKGFALIEQKKLEAAREALQRALELSPMNAQFLIELGQLYTINKQFDPAMTVYKQAEEAAGFAHEQQKNILIGHALRSQGYILIEQNKLEEAVKIYGKALELDPNDGRAKNQLRYIEQLRKKQKTN
ncbi:MAG: tetratricopeptide repeat protein [Betaproteobacteria bacterium]|nr:tetratricopeptide repeat protein [Betaproteobacteria bacterium]